MLRIRSDNALLGPSLLGSRNLDPDEIYDAYEAAVIAGGGTVYDESDTRDFIADLIAAGVYGAVHTAVIASGGDDNIGVAGDKVWSVGPGFTEIPLNDGSGVYTTRDTATYGWPAYKFPDNNAYLEIADVVARKDGATSVIIEGATIPVGAAGLYARLASDDYHYYMITGQLAVNVQTSAPAAYWPEGIEARTGLPASGLHPGYPLASKAVCSWYWDHAERSLFMTDNGRNEINRGRRFDGFPPIAVGDEVTVRLDQTGASNSAWRSFVLLNGAHSLEQNLDFSARRADRSAMP